MFLIQKYFQKQSKEVEWFQTLQKRVDEKFKFFDFINNHMANFNKILRTFSEKLDAQSKNLESLTYTLGDQCLYDAYKLIHQKIVDNIKAETTFAEENLKSLEIHMNKYRSERKIYNDLAEIYMKLVTEKETLKSNKTQYHKAGSEMEDKIKKFVKSNYNNINNLTPQLKKELISFVKSPKNLLKNYEESIDKVNKLSIEFNKKQDELFNLLPHFGREDNQFFTLLSTRFLDFLKKSSESIESTIKSMATIQQSEKKDDLNNLIDDCSNNKKIERKIELVQYQSSLEFSKCKDKNEFDLFSKVIENINKTMEEEIFPNYNYDTDLKNFNQAKLIKSIFEMKEIDEKAEKELLDSLDNKMNHKAIFIVLSQLRTNSTFQRPKCFIEVFGKAFNKLLSMANKNEIIEYVKNCIILSQTYFYIDENNKKRYLFEEIKSNKILNNSRFWRKFIDEVIKSEYDRFKVNHSCPDYDIEKCDTVPPKIKGKLDEIVFSQLLSFITNLCDFEMDKRLLVKIADEFVEKYKYLSETNKESIYQIISKEKGDIEKFRKEYDSSIESEEIEFKEEVKEEPKIAEKKEEPKAEEKKEEPKTEEKKEETKTEDKKEEEKKEEKKEDTIEEENLEANDIKNE
jgi:hypothetical protein